MLYLKGNGRYQQEYDALWSRLVPQSGQAETMQGELIRAIGRLGSEFRRNGNANWCRGYRMLTDFLRKHLWKVQVFDALTLGQILEDLEAIRGMGNGSRPLDYRDGEDPYDRITDRVVEWCQFYETLIPRPLNPKLHL